VFALRKKHITVSTVGVIPRIRSMATDMPGVSLALSLHAPNQELRKTIVPSARAYPLHKLLAAVQEYQEATQQRVRLGEHSVWAALVLPFSLPLLWSYPPAVSLCCVLLLHGVVAAWTSAERP
jgi:hypothetical protein